MLFNDKQTEAKSKHLEEVQKHSQHQGEHYKEPNDNSKATVTTKLLLSRIKA